MVWTSVDLVLNQSNFPHYLWREETYTTKKQARSMTPNRFGMKDRRAFGSNHRTNLESTLLLWRYCKRKWLPPSSNAKNRYLGVTGVKIKFHKYIAKLNYELSNRVTAIQDPPPPPPPPPYLLEYIVVFRNWDHTGLGKICTVRNQHPDALAATWRGWAHIICSVICRIAAV